MTTGWLLLLLTLTMAMVISSQIEGIEGTPIAPMRGNVLLWLKTFSQAELIRLELTLLYLTWLTYPAGQSRGGEGEASRAPRHLGARRRITALHIVDVQRSNPYNFRLLQSA